MEDRACCGKFFLAFLSALVIALVLLIDIGTEYGERGPGSVPPMFDGRASIVLALVYIAALVLYPFLSGWTAWIAAAVATAASFYTVAGIVNATAMLGLLSGIIGLAYAGPALMLLVFSVAEVISELSARRRA